MLAELKHVEYPDHYSAPSFEYEKTTKEASRKIGAFRKLPYPTQLNDYEESGIEKKFGGFAMDDSVRLRELERYSILSEYLMRSYGAITTTGINPSLSSRSDDVLIHTSNNEIGFGDVSFLSSLKKRLLDALTGIDAAVFVKSEERKIEKIPKELVMLSSLLSFASLFSAFLIGILASHGFFVSSLAFLVIAVSCVALRKAVSL